jgi:hypothetical protein
MIKKRKEKAKQKKTKKRFMFYVTYIEEATEEALALALSN